jgi:hypothetical protein
MPGCVPAEVWFRIRQKSRGKDAAVAGDAPQGMTAVIVWPDGASASGRPGMLLGGLSLLGRSLRTARYAGCGRLVVVGGEEGSRAARAEDGRGGAELGGVDWLEADEAPGVSRPALLLLPEVVVTPGDLRAWRERVPAGTALAAPDTGGLGPVVVSPALLPACLAAARGGAKGLAAFLAGRAASGGLAEVPWEGTLREPVESPEAVPAVERKLLRALRTPEDGPLVDR